MKLCFMDAIFDHRDFTIKVIAPHNEVEVSQALKSGDLTFIDEYALEINAFKADGSYVLVNKVLGVIECRTTTV